MQIVLQERDVMASSASDGDVQDSEIRLWREDDQWIATDLETGVTSQGSSRDVALENLDKALALHNGERGREPTKDDLRELGIDPADNTTAAPCQTVVSTAGPGSGSDQSPASRRLSRTAPMGPFSSAVRKSWPTISMVILCSERSVSRSTTNWSPR